MFGLTPYSSVGMYDGGGFVAGGPEGVGLASERVYDGGLESGGIVDVADGVSLGVGDGGHVAAVVVGHG